MSGWFQRGILGLIVVVIVCGIFAGPGIVTAEERPTIVAQTDQPDLALDTADGSVAPGETVTVTVNAENAGVLLLEGIPTDWTIDSVETAGAEVVEGTGDGAQKIGWTWSEDQDSVSVDVTLSVPADATSGDTSLSAEASNSEDTTETADGTITVTDPTTPEPVDPSVSVTDGSVAPGETATVTVSAEDVGVLSLADIPSDWTIESVDDAGAEVVEGTKDGAQKIGWTWDDDQDSVSVDVTLSVPEDATSGDTSLSAEATNSEDATTTADGTVSVTDSTTPADEPAVNLDGAVVEPGESTTVTVNAEDVGLLSLADIPADWTIESVDDAGAEVVEGTDDGAQKIGWTWDSDQDSVSVDVELSVPDDATLGETTLTAGGSNTDDTIASDTATVSVTDETPTDESGQNATTEEPSDIVDQYMQIDEPRDELQPSEVMQAKGDYLSDIITIEQVQEIIRWHMGFSTDVGTVEPEKVPTVVDQSDDLAVKPGENVTISVTYENAAGIRVEQIPDSWELVHSSSGVSEEDVSGDTNVVGSINDENANGTFNATYQVPENTSGDYEFPFTLDRFLGGNATSSISVTVDGNDTTEEPSDIVEQYMQIKEPTDELQSTEVILAQEHMERGELRLRDAMKISRAYNDEISTGDTWPNESPRLINQTDNLTVQPGENVTLSVTYENATEIRIEQIPDSWTLVHSPPGVVEKDVPEIDSKIVESAATENRSGTLRATYQVPENASGDYELPLTKFSEPGQDAISSISVSVSEEATPDPVDPSVSVTDGSVAPGETATVTVSAENADLLSLASIPSDWTIESYEKNGAEVVDGTSDGAQKLGWTWSEDQDSNELDVTLAVPEDATSGDTSLSVEASNSEGAMVTDTGAISVTEPESTETEDSDSLGPIGGGVDITTEEPTDTEETVQTPVETTDETTDEPETDEPTTDEPTTTEDVGGGGGETPDSDGGLPVPPIAIVVALGIVASLGVFLLTESLLHTRQID